MEIMSLNAYKVRKNYKTQPAGFRNALQFFENRSNRVQSIREGLFLVKNFQPRGVEGSLKFQRETWILRHIVRKISLKYLF